MLIPFRYWVALVSSVLSFLHCSQTSSVGARTPSNRRSIKTNRKTPLTVLPRGPLTSEASTEPAVRALHSPVLRPTQPLVTQVLYQHHGCTNSNKSRGSITSGSLTYRTAGSPKGSVLL